MEPVFSNRMKDLNGTATREIFKLLSRPEIVSFAGGLPANEFLPVEDIKNITHEILSSSYAPKVLQYGATEGIEPFRIALTEYLKDIGIDNLATENTLVISGGQQGIDLCVKCFINPGDIALVEDPTYLAFLQILKSYEGEAVGVKANADGLDLTDLESKIKKHKPKMLYCVPTFSNPTGKTYSPENRKKIAQITAKYGVIVLEDDPYSKLRFSGDSVKPLKAYDESGNIIYITSFSKVLSPALRVGVAAGGKEIIRKLTIAKQGADLHTANLSQYIALEYLKRGLLKENVSKSLPTYLIRKNAMITALKKYMPDEFTFNDPEGGLFVWGSFNANVDTAENLKRALEANVAYIQGSVFCANPDDGKNSLRLNFSNESPERIEGGIERLGNLYKKILTESER